jgi:hypothetical protein
VDPAPVTAHIDQLKHEQTDLKRALASGEQAATSRPHADLDTTCEILDQLPLLDNQLTEADPRRHVSPRCRRAARLRRSAQLREHTSDSLHQFGRDVDDRVGARAGKLLSAADTPRHTDGGDRTRVCPHDVE